MWEFLKLDSIVGAVVVCVFIICNMISEINDSRSKKNDKKPAATENSTKTE